jgi:hypothetical protein
MKFAMARAPSLPQARDEARALPNPQFYARDNHEHASLRSSLRPAVVDVSTGKMPVFPTAKMAVPREIPINDLRYALRVETCLNFPDRKLQIYNRKFP